MSALRIELSDIALNVVASSWIPNGLTTIFSHSKLMDKLLGHCYQDFSITSYCHYYNHYCNYGIIMYVDYLESFQAITIAYLATLQEFDLFSGIQGFIKNSGIYAFPSTN